MYIIVHGNSMKGFTIIETLIALTMLMLVTTGVIFALGNNIKSTAGSDVRIQAELLADEGLELVRAIKDTNLLTKKNMNTDITSSATYGAMCMSPSTCYVTNDGVGVPVLIPCSGTCPYIRTSALGYGYQASATDTVFRRSISVEVVRTNSVGQPVELRVTSTVTYPERGATVSAVAKTQLTEWYAF